MARKLFAFQVAKPVYAGSEEMVEEMTYDPGTQMATWRGGTSAMAFKFCTNRRGARKYCEAGNRGPDDYCSAWGNAQGFQRGYRCDCSGVTEPYC